MRGNIDFISLRNRELHEAYKRAFSDRDVRSHTQAIKRAIESPCSRFWVSTWQAYREILRLEKGMNHPLNMKPERVEMMDLIYKNYLSLKNKREFEGCSVYFITSFAVGFPAPKFFISYSRALTIITRYNRRGKYAKRNQ
jgi:hypothetical protein